MKIMHLINTLSAGGAELHLLTLCRYLSRRGIKLVVACLREQVRGSRSLRADFEKEGIQIITLNAYGRYDWHFPFKVLHLLKIEQPNILHTHLPRADLAGIVGRLFFPSIPWVCSVHNIYNKFWSGRRVLPLFNFIWSKADAIVAISDAVKEWLTRNRHLPVDKLTVIHYGMEPMRFAHPNFDLRKRLGLIERVVVGSLGRLELRKGHDILIRAMPLILKHVPNAFLLIGGHDPSCFGKVLQAIISELRLNKEVQLVGFQSDVPSFLHSIDVFAFASKSEGFGQVVIEAMAATKPVVVSKIPPLTEIVVDGESGLLVDHDNPKAFAEAIVWLLKNKEEARRISEQAAKRVNEVFSAERMAQKTIELYKALIHIND